MDEQVDALDLPTDAELLQAHVDGDPQAFGSLMQRHQDRLWAVALRTAGNPEDAADALQEAMIKAFRSAGSFRGDSAVTTWLHRIVVNACLDKLRRNKARPSVPLPGSDPDFGPDTLADPRDHHEISELRLELERALSELPPDQRAAIVLVDVQGFSVADAAEVLGCPAGTVKSRCARGRTRLASRLAGLRNPSETPGVPPEHRPADDRDGGGARRPGSQHGRHDQTRPDDAGRR